MDIVKGIKIENEYLERKVNGELVSLETSLHEAGFDSLEQYFKEKNLYQLRSCEFRIMPVTAESAPVEIINVLTNRITSVLYIDHEITAVYYGIKDFNKDYCDQNRIPTYYYGTEGGTIIGTKGDVTLGICFPSEIDIRTDMIMEMFISMFKKYGITLTVNGNDFLLDGKKVAGTAQYEMNDMFAFIVQFTFSDESELIKNVCYTSPSMKEVTYLDKQVISREQIKKEFFEWLQLCI